MRAGHVIGRITLNRQEPSLIGGRLLLVSPLDKEHYAGGDLGELSDGWTLIVYDNLGAGVGETIAFVEGAEATAPFEAPTPIDAFNCAIVERIDYDPPEHARRKPGSRRAARLAGSPEEANR